MSRSVLDASIALTWCFPDEHSADAQHALDLLPDRHPPSAGRVWSRITRFLMTANIGFRELIWVVIGSRVFLLSLNGDALDFIERQFIGRAVVQLRCAWRFMRGNLLRFFDRAAVR